MRVQCLSPATGDLFFYFPHWSYLSQCWPAPILSSQRPKPCWFNPCSPAPSTAAPGPREVYGYSWKEGRRKRRQEKAVDSKSQLSGLWRGRTHAYLVGRGVFWFHAVAAAGLFGNCPLSGVLGPVTQGPQELGGGPADQSSSKYCSKLIDAMPGREGAGIFHTWKTIHSGTKMKLFYICTITRRETKMMSEDI